MAMIMICSYFCFSMIDNKNEYYLYTERLSKMICTNTGLELNTVFFFLVPLFFLSRNVVLSGVP